MVCNRMATRAGLATMKGSRRFVKRAIPTVTFKIVVNQNACKSVLVRVFS